MGEDYLYDFWQFGLLALVQTIILQGKITGFLPPPTHSPWKQTPFMIQKRPHHFIHKIMCFFFPLRKCHHHCFCCSWSWTLWHLSVVRSFSQLELFSSASHGHKKTEHSFLYIWADLGGKNLCRNGGWKAAKCVFGVISVNKAKVDCSLFVQYEGFKSILWFTKFKPNVLSCVLSVLSTAVKLLYWKYYTLSGINEVHCGFTYITGIRKRFFPWCDAESDAALNKVFAFDNLQPISSKKSA